MIINLYSRPIPTKGPEPIFEGKVRTYLSKEEAIAKIEQEREIYGNNQSTAVPDQFAEQSNSFLDFLTRGTLFSKVTEDEVTVELNI